jgi:hypothetical protein
MNQLQAFIYFFKRMDIVMLDDILTDDISYCGITKALFLDKLLDIFVCNLFIEKETLAMQWSESNTNCLKFSCWKLDEFENTLLITSKEDGSIISFINKTPQFNHHNSNFRIYEDEEIGFVKSTEFIMLQNQCKNAIEEMTEVIFTTELILNWITKYETLQLEVRDEEELLIYANIKYIEEFYGLYDSTLMEQDFILNYKEAELAVLDFEKLELQDWLEKYHNLYFCVLIPTNSLADVLCENEYRFKVGNKEYKSKELFCVDRFTDLYHRMFNND